MGYDDDEYDDDHDDDDHDDDDNDASGFVGTRIRRGETPGGGGWATRGQRCARQSDDYDDDDDDDDADGKDGGVDARRKKWV